MYGFNSLRLVKICFITQDLVYIGEMFHVHVKRMCILLSRTLLKSQLL